MFSVLIVEDDKNIRRLMEIKLSAEGYNTVSAENGKAALSHVTALRDRLRDGVLQLPDVVVNSPADGSPYIFNFSLQGYRSEFDRDLDMQTRIQARKLELPTEPAAVVPQPEPAKPEPVKPEPVKPEPVIPQTVAPKTAVSTRVEIPSDIHVDINHCTQAELMQLPGISVVLAKQAMEYRAANGGFRSVEEFVEKLHIKPHFAVQIFNMATVSPNTPATPKTETGTVRRMIDF